MCVGLLPNLTLFLRERRRPLHRRGAIPPERAGAGGRGAAVGVERRSINNVGTPLGGCLLSEIEAVIPHSPPAHLPPRVRPARRSQATHLSLGKCQSNPIWPIKPLEWI